MAAFDQTVALDPKMAAAWQHRGNALLILKRYEEALEAFEQVLTLDPENATAWRDKGQLFIALRWPEEALQAFGLVFTLDQDATFDHDVDLWKNIGYAFTGLELHEEAVAAFEWALALDPENGKLWLGKFQALLRLERPEETLTAFERALALDPQWVREHEPMLVKTLTIGNPSSREEARENLRGILHAARWGRTLRSFVTRFSSKKRARLLALPSTTAILHKLAQLDKKQ